MVYDPTLLGPASDTLDGVYVGDALGGQFCLADPWTISSRASAGRASGWTHDTHMTCSVVAELRDQQVRLATAIAERGEPHRGVLPGVGVQAGNAHAPRSLAPTVKPRMSPTLCPATSSGATKTR